MGIGFAEGTYPLAVVRAVHLISQADLLVCVALGVDMVRKLNVGVLLD